jgi:hypothetical protein
MLRRLSDSASLGRLRSESDRMDCSMVHRHPALMLYAWAGKLSASTTSTDPSLSSSSSVMDGRVGTPAWASIFLGLFLLGLKRGAVTDDAAHFLGLLDFLRPRCWGTSSNAGAGRAERSRSRLPIAGGVSGISSSICWSFRGFSSWNSSLAA